MFKEGRLDKLLRSIKRFIPKRLFDLGAKIYHPLLAWSGALRYGFPSRRLIVIGVTGTKGKSTTVWLVARILEDAGHPTAAIGSLGYKIKEKTWPNLLRMTMPGRWKLQKFLRQAVSAKCEFCIIETPSEGLAQGRHLGVKFGVAMFLGMHPEHLEAHGSWEQYRAAKQLLFKVCKGLHVVNADDPSADQFLKFSARKHITFGVKHGDIQATDIQADAHGSTFQVGDVPVRLHLGGMFNVYNALAAMAVSDAFGVVAAQSAETFASIRNIAGRMEWVQKEPFGVVVDYAHTPDSLEAVYKTLKSQAKRLICVLGGAGGGRDKWKRPKFGALAERYCDRIYLTSEDPFDEDPAHIVEDIASGISGPAQNAKVVRELDRRKATAKALTDAQENDIVVITGKGSEISMSLAGGRKIPWSDTQTVQELLQESQQL